MKVAEITAKTLPTEIIADLKTGRDSDAPDIAKAEKGLDPLKHDVFDYTKRPDKIVKVDVEDGGTKVITTDDPETSTRREPVARIAISIQKLIVKRAVSFLFGNEVALDAEAENDNQKLVLKAMKRILYDVKSKSLNRRLARTVFSSTEAAELWYPVEKLHKDYGFSSKFKLRATIFSPLKGDELYPYFDDSGDMVAFSRAFKQTKNGVTKRFFETYTDEEHWLWEYASEGVIVVEGYPKQIAIGKIPVIYARQPQLEWEDVQVLIDRLEKLLSNFADTNDYHASPKIFVKGHIEGFSKKGEAGAILEGDENSEAQYLAWQNAPESVKLEIETLLNLIYTLTQTPDISFENVKGIGAVSGVALKLLFMDAHLKAEDKKEVFDEFMQRRINVIKAFIGKFDTGLANDCDTLMIEPEITPYMIDDDRANIDLIVAANGGKPIISQKKSVGLSGLVNDAEAEFEQIQEEAKQEQSFILGEPTVA